jgi:endonuclease/exonuclease/phosphatase family metal-dependent hydrolase
MNESMASTGTKRALLQRATTWSCTIYLLLILSVWAILHFCADVYWPGTLLLFSPAWIYAVPLVPLSVAAAIWRRRLLWMLGAVGIVILFPIMDFRLPWAAFQPSGPHLRVLTCNVEGGAFRPESLAALIDELEPDVVALQEYTSAVEPQFPKGWSTNHFGEFLTASRYPLGQPQYYPRPTARWVIETPTVSYTVETPMGTVRFFNVHLESPRQGLEALLSRKTIPDGPEVIRQNTSRRDTESAQISQVAGELDRPTILAGDFNMPSASAIYRRDWSGLTDAFAAAGTGFGHTKMTGPRPLSYGMRIDHILTSSHWQCAECRVAGNIGSDHLPLVADLAYKP